jgi:hypothetical protein
VIESLEGESLLKATIIKDRPSHYIDNNQFTIYDKQTMSVHCRKILLRKLATNVRGKGLLIGTDLTYNIYILIYISYVTIGGVLQVRPLVSTANKTDLHDITDILFIKWR